MLLWRFFWAVLFAAAIFSDLHPQSPRFRFERLSVADGLSQNSVYCILQDRQGFMWFGTADGLNRYDGYQITVYRHNPLDPHSISENTIRDIAEDAEGNLWIATDGGVNKWARREDKFYRFTLNSERADSGHSANRYANLTQAVYPDQAGIVWVGALRGLYALRPESGEIRLYRPAGLRDEIYFAVNEIRRAPGSLWIGLTGFGLYRFEPETGRFFPCPFPDTLREPTISSKIVEDRAGDLWMGTWEDGLWKYQLHTQTFINYRHDPQNPFSLSHNQVLSISEDNSGFLWVGTGDGGLNLLDPSSGQFNHYLYREGDPHSLSANYVSSLFCDRSGLLWIGTDGGGVNKLNPHLPKFSHYHSGAGSPLSLPGNFLKAIYEDRQGALWLGAYGDGLCRIDPEDGRTTCFRANPHRSNSLSSDHVNCILEDRRGDLWIGTDKGINYFKRPGKDRQGSEQGAGRFIHYLQGAVRTLLEDRGGNIWLGSPGLWRIEPASATFTQYMNDPANPNSLSDNWIWTLHQSADGLLWIGTNDGGLNCFDPGTGRFVHYLHNPYDSTSISSNAVRTILEDPRQAGRLLWIGTENGLNRFDRETGQFTRYYEKHGLPNAFIYGILADDNGNLWISSNRGLSKFNLQTETFRNYDPGDGLQSYEFNTGAYFKSRSGKMFFGGVNGLNVFHPDSVKNNPHIPAVVLTGFKKFDQPADLGQNPAMVQEIRLRHNESVFSFQFAALEYTNPAKNRYTCKMEGFDKDWIDCGARREVRYTHLDPGAYTFRVKARNNDGVWNEKGLEIRVLIEPPFWAAWWFRALAALVILGVLGGGVRYQVLRKVRQKIAALERERELERERARISRDMHDEVGASLSRISILSNLAQSGALPPEEVRDSLNQISQTAAGVVDEMSEIIWALNPKNDTLDNLAAYLRQYAARYFQPTAIRCQFQFPEIIPGIKLNAEARRNLFLAVKEALHNVQKHSGASEVRLGLAIAPGQMEIKIQDNGKGFDPDSLSGLGNGLPNMQKRIEDIGGVFTIESRTGSGTYITIRLSLKAVR